MKGVTEDAVEQAMLEWLVSLGWSVPHGPDISPPDNKTPGTERERDRDRDRELALLPRRISGKLLLPEAEEQLEEIQA